jgi:hypothetical protein
MKSVRVVDQFGNKTDYETETVPRIGERIVMDYGIGSEPVRPHYFRVVDVMYNLSMKEDNAAVLVTEETNPKHWPD